MSKTIATLDVNTDTFQNWTDKTNEIINVISSESVTANSTGALTTGNGFVVGVFGANVLVANASLRGGNVSTTNTLYVTSQMEISNNLNVTGDILVSGAPVVSVIKISDTTSTTNPELIDQFSTSTFSGCEYVAAIKQNSVNAYQISKLLVLHDTGNSYITEYAVIFSNTVLGVFSSNVDSTNCRLWLTPTVAGTTLKLTKMGVDVL